jgi:hypothetical protein
MRTEKWLVALVAIAGIVTITVVAMLSAPKCKADSLSFIQALNDNGIVVYDTSKALSAGVAICNALETTNGVDVARNLYRITSYSDVPTPAIAAVWVIVSAQELCPAMDHSTNGSSGGGAVGGPFRA